MNVVKETNQAQSPELLLPSGLGVIPTFAAFLPEFSGFASAGWAALISGPRRRAAESGELIEMNDGVLDPGDFLAIFDETARRSTAALRDRQVVLRDLQHTPDGLARNRKRSGVS